jgi:hypothetical protein
MEIQDLLEQKAFDELTETEYNYVLSELTEAEYKEQRNIILVSSAFFEMDEDEADLEPLRPSKALAALKQQSVPKLGFWKAAFGYQISAWKAVAAALLIGFLAQFSVSNISGGDSELALNQNKIDTVVVEKYITKTEKIFQPADTVIEVIYKTIYAQKPENEPKLIAEMITNTSSEEEDYTITDSREFANILQYCSTHAGVPASQDTFLELFSSDLPY